MQVHHGSSRMFNGVAVVRSVTGHVTERMTEHYSHVEAEEKQQAVRAVLHLVSTAVHESGTLGGTWANTHEKSQLGINA